MLLRQYLPVCLLVLLALSAQGCYTLNQAGGPVQEVIEMTNAEQARSINHFTKTKRVNHFVYGLVSPEDVGIEKLVSDAVKTAGGSRAVNVRINYQMTLVDGLISGLTFGIYSPFTLTVEGDVVK